MSFPMPDGVRLDPARKEAMRALLEEAVAQGSTRPHWARGPVTVGVGAALVLAGGTAAAYVMQRPVTETDIVHCFAKAELDRGGEYAGASVAVTDYELGAIPIEDAIAACSRLWSDGLLDPDAEPGEGLPEPDAGRVGAVPARLTVCVMDDGAAAVVPGGPDVCATTGLADVADQP